MNDRIPETQESFIVSIELADNPSLQSRLSTGISQTIVTIQDNDCMCLKIVMTILETYFKHETITCNKFSYMLMVIDQ